MADKKYTTTIQSSPWDSFNRDNNIVTAYACDINDVGVLSGSASADSGIDISLGKGTISFSANGKDTVSFNEIATKDELDDKIKQIEDSCVNGKTYTTGLNQLQKQINELRAQIEKPVDTLGTLRRTLKTLKYEREVI